MWYVWITIDRRAWSWERAEDFCESYTLRIEAESEAEALEIARERICPSTFENAEVTMSAAEM